MLRAFSNLVYRRLFVAQIVALLGTGLLTIALGLTAYDLAGDKAGQVLGLALTIKMVAYVGLSPVAAALVARLDRRAVLIGADLLRAGAALCLPFIDAAWQIYALIFVLQAASATFTPTFQAAIPDVLPDEADYTAALSLSRLAYDLENIVSPVLAGLLLSLVAPSWLFAGTTLGFVLSAALVQSIHLPAATARTDQPFRKRLTSGARIYLATPRLRGLLALNATYAAVGSVVIVLSVVLARSTYGGAERDLAVILGAHGAGSMAAALILPRLLGRLHDRPVMLFSAAAAALLMGLTGLYVLLAGWPPWGVLLAVWALTGAAIAGVQTPSGRLLRRSAHAADRPAVFAAQFALSHACWLVAYPAAGLLGSSIGVSATMLTMGLLAGSGLVLARAVWPTAPTPELEHSHDDLPPGHPHLHDAERRGGVWVHRHTFVIDDEHRVWPTAG
ncbi:MAG: MFS transporter [Rhodobacteraceae bacterium]|nr:MFS transporter [Paracoccaceae bacterium]